MSDNIYDIIGKLDGLGSKSNPVSTSAEPVYENVDPKDITASVNSMMDKYENFLIEEKAKKSQDQKDDDIARGEPEVVKLLNKARLERPTAASDMEAFAYQMVKANKELEKAQADNDEQEKKIADLDAKVVALSTAKPAAVQAPTPAPAVTAQPTAAAPTTAPAARPSATILRMPTPTTAEVPAQAPAEVPSQAPATAEVPGKSAKSANVDSQVSLIRKGTDPGRGQQPIDPAQAVVGPKEEPKKSNVIKGKFGKPQSAVTADPLQRMFGESVNKGKNMLKENIQMLIEYREGDPQLALFNWNTLINAWKKRQPKIDLDFAGKSLTICKEQMYGILSEFATDQNAERRMQRVEDILSSHDATVQFMMLPRVKKFINNIHNLKRTILY